MLTVRTVYQDFWKAVGGGFRLCRALAPVGIAVDASKPFRILPPMDGQIQISAEQWSFILIKTDHGWGFKGFQYKESGDEKDPLISRHGRDALRKGYRRDRDLSRSRGR